MSSEENGGCLKTILGFVLMVIVCALVYFVLSPIAITVVGFLFAIAVVVLIIAWIASWFSD